jgi:hypothetical protein
MRMTDDQQREQAKRPAAGREPRPAPHPVADEPLPDPDAADAAVQNPITETGLPVEEQVRKEWDWEKDGGLPTPLRRVQE